MIYIIQGATASGKTSLAITLAQYLKTEIISSDSRQFYREMNIGTAKPTKQELSLVPHHFINNRSVREPMNVTDFVREATLKLVDIYQKNGSVVVVGGSSQFTDALIYGIDEVPIYPQIQKYWTQVYSLKGIQELQIKLNAIDPVAYKEIDVQNSRRLIRAIEVKLGSGKSILDYQSNKQTPLFPILRYHIQWRREDLYNRINDRVNQMIDQGLEMEVDSLSEYKALKSFNTVGYKEWDMKEHGANISEIEQKIKQNTRNYAKRQLTWLNRYNHIIPLNPYSNKPLIKQVIELNSNHNLS